MTFYSSAEQVVDLMKSFYILSGIRFVLFGADFQKIIAYPEADCTFCHIMKSHPTTKQKCTLSDRYSLEKCQQTGALVQYQCHAGLVEATIPLQENGKIIGYLMFGQITDQTDRSFLEAQIPGFAKECALPEETLRQSVGSISFRSPEEIMAATRIMEACTSYIILKELIPPKSDRVFELAKEFIDGHLSEDLDANVLCQQLDISRTRLYEVFRKEVQMGVSEYIRNRRLHQAKKLLKSTDRSVWEIAQAVGFADYNYFSRIYKKKYGHSPKGFRRNSTLP